MINTNTAHLIKRNTTRRHTRSQLLILLDTSKHKQKWIFFLSFGHDWHSWMHTWHNFNFVSISFKNLDMTWHILLRTIDTKTTRTQFLVSISCQLHFLWRHVLLLFIKLAILITYNTWAMDAQIMLNKSILDM